MSRSIRLRTDESGFTLIELVVTIVIMGVIFVPLADFFIQYLSSYNQTQARLSDSHDLQISAAYFSQDVANTGLRNQTAGQTTFAPQQSVWTNNIPAGFCGGTVVGTPILLLKGDAESVGSGSGSDTITSVLYVVNAGALVRHSCSGSAADPDATVVHNLDGTPTVQCSSSCNATTPPATITLTLSVRNSATDTAGATVTLTGKRRQASS
jgi:prepilin-type N-terminal cleavage/methylation domain-containing protein